MTTQKSSNGKENTIIQISPLLFEIFRPYTKLLKCNFVSVFRLTEDRNMKYRRNILNKSGLTLYSNSQN